MPKIKTSRAAAKRFKKTGSGQLKRMKAYNIICSIFCNSSSYISGKYVSVADAVQ